MRSRATGVYLAFCLAGGALFLLLPNDRPGRAAAFGAVNAAAFLALAVGMRRGAGARFWHTLLLGEAAYLAASVGWWVYPIFAEPLAFPSVIDAFFFVSYGLFALFLLQLERECGGVRWGEAIDAAAVALGAGAMLFIALDDSLGAQAGLHAATVVTLGYPLALVLLLFLGVRISAFAQSSSLVLLLVLWLAAELVADVVYVVDSAAGTASYGELSAVFWLLSYAALGVAGLHRDFGRRLSERPRRAGTTRLIRLLGLGVVAALPIAATALAIHNGERGVALGMVAVTLVVFVLVLVRAGTLMVGLREQRKVTTELSALTEELRVQAVHDALTGLRNRTIIDETLRTRFEDHDATDGRVALLLLDVDGFKSANDTLGHIAGDEILKAIAERLRGAVGTAGILGRTGGDEFCLLMDVRAEDEAISAARRIVRALAEPLAIPPIEYRPRVSVGVATSEAGVEPIELVRRADNAMYAAKTAGLGGYAVYTRQLGAKAEERRRLELEMGLALAHEELELHYQPIVALGSSRVVGVEALLRWRHPRLGLIAPDRFIEIAEATGEIRSIGPWVLEQAGRQVQAWDAVTATPLTVAVNISPVELQSPHVLGVMKAALAASAIDPCRVVLEVTEGAFSRDPEAMVANLQSLGTLGVRVAVDDFGTGYSSLGYLRRLPVDVVKIDRSFVDGIVREPQEFALAAAIVDLAVALGKHSLAEGVETSAQAAHLRAMGCELAQGYLFSRPLPADELEAFLVRTRVEGMAASSAA